MLAHCPRCNTRYSHQPYDTDYVHECNSGNETLDQEDIPKLGTWTDFDGTTHIEHPQFTTTTGRDNKLWGSRAWVEGDKTDILTRRGVNADTHFTRKNFQYIKLKG